MSWILVICGAILLVAAFLTLWRMVKGPTPLDRIVAGDVMVCIVIACIGVITIARKDDSGLPMVLVLSLLGFTAAVSVARLLGTSVTVRRTFERRKALHEEDRDAGGEPR